MKVDLCLREDAQTKPGGDFIQVQKLCAALRELEVDAQISFGRPDRHPDIVHIFNSCRIFTPYEVSQWCMEKRIPYIYTPIWHRLAAMQKFYAHLYRIPNIPIKEYLSIKEPTYEGKKAAQYALNPGLWEKNVRSVFENSAHILVNSPEEAETIGQELNTHFKHSVFPNAIETECKRFSRLRSKSIICPGRIEPNKNSISVAKAFEKTGLQGMGYELNFIGALSTRHTGYVNRFLSEIERPGIRYLGSVPYETAQYLYAGSVMLILGSFFETTGLCGLEALYQGTPVVMTKYNYCDYYYDIGTHFCDPYDVDSMSQAIIKTLSKTDHAAIKSKDFSSFSWLHASKIALQAYEKII